MEQKNEIALARQQNKLTTLTSTNLPVSRKKYLQLHYGCKKVKDYEEEDLKSLFKFILALCKLVGVTEAPDNEIILLLIDHIQEHHSDFSKEEIQKSFSMATAGKLGFDFVHYNRITPQLISNTLNSYKVFRSREIIEYENRLRAEEEEERRIKEMPTPKQSLVSRVNSCLDLFVHYKEQKSIEESKRKESKDWGAYSYLFLEEIGLIEYTNEVKAEIKDLAKEKMISDKKKEYSEFSKRGIGKIIEEINNDTNFQIKIVARQIALERYFDNLIEFKVVLAQEIQEKMIESEDELISDVGNMLKNARKRSRS
jgi:hypothetical protein